VGAAFVPGDGSWGSVAGDVLNKKSGVRSQKRNRVDGRMIRKACLHMSIYFGL
jgi:hypothetical protein